ncbi:glycosyl hydrolase family 28-related protein [uncultured Paludibaculum sp.]|uniref:glycosyl hydrolase family 28-related protein n=1 Tax=uncultured Paludibaculum sp. TaxID=1765020 RepID=UPI002AAACAB6|nr:glycosyl hydrolase family 28-related protein [uncultured Paludibaculum sp.]
MKRISTVVACLSVALPLAAASYYTARPEDPKAVYLTNENFAVKGDGVADDTVALQSAIDKVQETTGQGVVFVPQGRYRITKTIHVWPGIRLIGYGAQRPVLVLAAATPGYQDLNQENYMVFFTGNRPGAGRGPRPGGGNAQQPPGPRRSGLNQANLSQPLDANPGTFYSALSNIDFEIGAGNEGAVAVRGRYAQHCYLAHVEFRLGSALAGIHDGGNYGEDLHFVGGQYGLFTRKPSPGWQLTLVDTIFEGQKRAAIRTHEAGLTLVHPVIRNVPTAIDIDAGYVEELWIKNGRLENITGPAIIISREKSPRTEVNLEDLDCRDVPVLAMLRESGTRVAGPAPLYHVKAFSHGLHYADIGATGTFRTDLQAAAIRTMPADHADLPALPAQDSWVNVHTLGVKGDGTTDDTAALRQAIAAHRSLYFPMGMYRVTDTIRMRPDTVLVGLHPSRTALVLADGTEAFQGLGGPVPVLEAPKGGTNLVAGLGIYTNGMNPRAVAALWMAGQNSMMNDVRFLGGHGTSKIDGTREDIYNNTHTADPNLNRRWDSQYPSLWVTNGGGGTFADIWTPSTFARAGLLVSDTTTPGRVYHMSSEHHVRYELQFRRVSNWAVYAPQTEEERGESGSAIPMEIEDSSNITVANFHLYRVVSSFQPFPYAISVTGSKDIRLRNVHCYTDAKASFESAVYDQTHNGQMRQREFAWMNISGAAPVVQPKRTSTLLPPGAKVERLAGGFFNVSGGAVSSTGDYYFVDARWQRIYRWAAATRSLSTVSDAPLEPVNLFFDKADNLCVVSYGGKGVVYCLEPGKPGVPVTMLQPQAATPRGGLTPVLPVDHWRLENDFLETVPVRKPAQYVTPDGSTFLPAGEDFVTGRLYYGSKLVDVIRAFGLSPAKAGQPFYVSDEEQHRTYVATVDSEGTLQNTKLFVEQAAEGVAVDARGNVYLAAGQIYVYSPAGVLIDTIEVPERPVQLAFGGKDGKTLFIAARSSIYAVRTLNAGR